MIRENSFPFTAVIGQEKLKLALILNVINPDINGVLISGEKGTAKSTLVRGLAHLIKDMHVVEVPLNITEDRLVGTLNFTGSIKDGKRHIEYGVLGKADGQFLYIDEVNLLSAHISNIIAEVASKGENIIERDGISFSHSCKFIPVGTMNPEEGFLNPQFLDKFGLFVVVSGEKDINKRIEIIRRHLEYEGNTIEYFLKYSNEDKLLAEKISLAKSFLSKVKITEKNIEFAALISRNARCEGNRCEIILIETSRALAAWNGRNYISEEDIRFASELVLPHRMHEVKEHNMNNDTNKVEIENKTEYENTSEFDDKPNIQTDDNDSCEISEENNDEQTDVADNKYDISLKTVENRRKKLLGSGRRNKVKSCQSSGRYVKSGVPHKKTNDIAVIPTLCRAALNQRENNQLSNIKILVKPDDFREKIREKRTGATILFVVDASGSMGAKRRMRAVKGAVMSLLSEAYRKRDRVGVVAFKGLSAEVLLNITPSLDLAEKCLRTLPTGGKTPLADGLYKAERLLKAERIRNPDVIQYMVLISDGKTNVPVKSDNALADATEIADIIKCNGINIMVLDTENGYIQFGFAKKLSEHMNAQYVKLDNISSSDISENVRIFQSKQ